MIGIKEKIYSLSEILLAAHPVGSYYWSEDATPPSELFGGSWVQITDKFVLAAGGTYTVGSSGGAATCTLNANNFPGGTVVMLQNTTGGALSMPSFTEATATINNSGWVAATISKHYDYGTISSRNTAFNNMPPYVVAYCWKRTS